MASSNIERIRQKRLAVRLTVLALAALGLIIFLASRGDETKDSAIFSTLEDGVTPVLVYATMPLRGIETMLAEFEARGDVLEENKRLREALVQLQDAETRANALALKIAKFESLLQVDVGSGISSERIAARAVSERDGPFVRSALLNAGRNRGVEKGNAVMTDDGLYGHVVRVGRQSARALKLTDLNSRVAVMSLRSQGRAILTGNNTEFPLLSYVTNAEDWQVGDRVITSGDDGVLPRGLPVGKIREDKSGVMKVELNVDGTRVDWVLIVPFDEIQSLADEEALERLAGETADPNAVPADTPTDAPTDAPTDLLANTNADTANTDGGAVPSVETAPQDVPTPQTGTGSSEPLGAANNPAMPLETPVVPQAGVQ